MTPELPPLAKAYLLYQKGFAAEAAAVCRDTLRSNPADAEALHLLGIIEAKNNNSVAALELIQRAIALNPDIDRFHLSRGVVLQQLNRLDDALVSIDFALKLRPDYPRALNSRGAILQELGHIDDALASYSRAIAINPAYADALINRGVLLHDQGCLDGALADYDNAIAVKPDCAEAFNDRGLVLRRLNRFADALDSFERATKLKPDYAAAFNNVGFTLHKLGRFQEAIQSYQLALAVAPDFIEALNNLGVTFHRVNRFEEALAVYDRALAINANSSEALCNRGQVLLVRGEIRQAIDSLRRAAAIGNNSAVHSAFIFALNFDPAATAVVKQSERSKWAQRYGAPLRRPNSFRADTANNRRLRIGYLSSYFRRNAATYSFGGVITNHERANFEIVCYSDTTIRDDVTDLIRRRADAWRETSGMSDEELAHVIRKDRIDILVDPVGHMAGNRLLVFARKPAPVQVTGWGEPTGTGLPEMDYLLADKMLVPDQERALLAERIVQLPNFLGYWMPDAIPPSRGLPAAERGYVTFGSFNRLEKLSADTLSTWAVLLRKVPTARIVLKDRALENVAEKMRLTNFFANNGVSAERLTCLAESERAAHLSMYQEIDIGLDPFPHSGGMTTLDALWMGIPVVTWAGQTISSRLAASSLAALGLNSFIADDLDAYVDIAVAASNDIVGLSGLRSTLRDRLAASEFGDPVQYCRAVESAYTDIWRRWRDARVMPGSVHDHRAD